MFACVVLSCLALSLSLSLSLCYRLLCCRVLYCSTPPTTYPKPNLNPSTLLPSFSDVLYFVGLLVSRPPLYFSLVQVFNLLCLVLCWVVRCNHNPNLDPNTTPTPPYHPPPVMLLLFFSGLLVSLPPLMQVCAGFDFCNLVFCLLVLCCLALSLCCAVLLCVVFCCVIVCCILLCCSVLCCVVWCCCVL